MTGIYWEHVQRNLGLISQAEQARLKEAKVAIAGLGGVGGGTFLSLCRMGVGRFAIADPEVFGCSDLNRQQGACVESLGKKKVEVLRQMAAAINPEISIEAFPEGLTLDNLEAFLSGANFAVDALDYFALPVRQALHDRARQKNLYVSLSAIFGFGASLAVFSPTGTSFKDLFGRVEGVFPIGHRIEFGRFLFPIIPGYLDVRAYADSMREDRPIPSFCAAAALSAGLQSMDVVLHLLGRRAPVVVPKIKWIDLYEQRFEIIDPASPLTRLRRLLGTVQAARKLFGRSR